MTLSIITINYNNAEGLRKTLDSVLSQTSHDFEHIIIDGASTDNSVEIIKSYATKSPHPVIWLSEPDTGIYNAMNKGIRKATSDYIQILNSGDSLASYDVEENMMHSLSEANSLNNNEPVAILYGNMIRITSEGKRMTDSCLGLRDNKSSNVRLTRWTMNDFIRGTINHDPTFIRRDLFDKYGLYDEILKICSDWKWFVKSVIFGGEKVYYTPLDVTLFDTSGISETNLTLREEERLNELRKFLPDTILNDYLEWHFPMDQYRRLKRHKLWPFVYFIERVLFKFEKWGLLKK